MIKTTKKMAAYSKKIFSASFPQHATDCATSDASPKTALLFSVGE